MQISTRRELLVHLASGIGNIIFATPLLLVLNRNGYTVDLLLDADYVETAELFHEWSAIRTVYNAGAGERPPTPPELTLPAIPPFYWNRFSASYLSVPHVRRPPDELFYHDEQAYYLEFARALGCDIDNPPYYFLPCAPTKDYDVCETTLVLAPGCKTGEMASKRWPHFPALAERFDDVVLVGTTADLYRTDGAIMSFPAHVRSLVGKLPIRETAAALGAAGVVVANDAGLGHMAGAVGTSTVLLFGPTPDTTLGRFPPNVKVLRAELECEPCWFSRRFAACAGRISCLEGLSCDLVTAVVAERLHPSMAARAVLTL